MKKWLLWLSFAAPVWQAQAQTLTRQFALPASLSEISGMIPSSGGWLVHGDGGSAAALYRLSMSGICTDTLNISASNQDWEDMAADNKFVYIADFGNNNGTRKDLHILKISRDSLHLPAIRPEIIEFYYPDQKDFTANTFSDFDAEAIVSLGDSLLLFSKSKETAVCRIYSLTVVPGKQTARLIDTLTLPFWVTGAALKDEQLMLIGYSPNWDLSLSPWLYQGRWSGGKLQKKQGYWMSLKTDGSTQTEAIANDSAGRIWVSAEAYRGSEAAFFLLSYPQTGWNDLPAADVSPYPNPVDRGVYTGAGQETRYEVRDLQGKVVKSGYTSADGFADTTGLAPGSYILSWKQGCRRKSQTLVIN